MSRSPSAGTVSGEYDQAWQAINDLIREDGSWSGRERNNCYLNLGDGTFVEVSGAAGLDFPEDGRALAVWDYDRDGDLDLLLKNRNGPQLRLLRNDTPTRNRTVGVRLIARQANRDAVGAQVRMRVGQRWQTASVVSGSGFLSQSSALLYFGVGEAESISELEVIWPGGSLQRWDGPIDVGRLLEIRQDEARLGGQAFVSDNDQVAVGPLPPPRSERGHSRLALPAVAPPFHLVDLDGNLAGLDDFADGFRLLNFWATWCGPCRGELKEWAAGDRTFREAGVGVLAISVDDEADRERVVSFRSELGLPFAVFHSCSELTRRYNIFYRSLFPRRSDMQIPTSLLVDPEGRVRKIYRGPTTPEAVAADVARVSAAAEAESAGTPFEGRAINFRPGRDEFGLGTAYLTAGFYSDAIRVLQRVVERSPGDAPAWGNLGVAYLESGRPGQARQALGRALDEQPDYLQAWLNLGQLELGLGRPEAALPRYQQAAVLAPDQAAAQMPLALLEAQLGRPEKAVEIVERYLRLRPGDAEALNSLGIFYAQAGRLDDAKRVFSQATEIRPDLGEAHLNLGRASLESGRAVEAVASLKEAARLLPERPPVHYYLAQALLAAGHRSEARQALERVLELDPSSSEAQRLLQEIGPGPR